MFFLTIKYSSFLFSVKLVPINGDTRSIDPVTVVVDKEFSKMNSVLITRFLLLFVLVLIIGLIIVIGACIMKIGKLKSELKTRNTAISIEQTKNNNSIEANERLTYQLNMYKHVLSML